MCKSEPSLRDAQYNCAIQYADVHPDCGNMKGPTSSGLLLVLGPRSSAKKESKSRDPEDLVFRFDHTLVLGSAMRQPWGGQDLWI